MTHKRRPSGYWNKETVLAEAKKYKYKMDWVKHSHHTYKMACRNGWKEEACAHMEEVQKPLGFWTTENLIKDAMKYKTRSQWKKASGSAYNTALRQNVLDQCTKHMKRMVKPEGYWTREKCRGSAEEYLTIREWSLADGAAYDAAKRNGWMEYVSKHMVKKFSHGELTIYRLFLQHDIYFVYQKRFDDLKDKSYLPYDFYLPDMNLVIEYQGRQHFEVSKSSMFNNDMVAMQRRDDIKKQYAEQKGIHYLQIDAEVVSEIENAVIKKIQSIDKKLVLIKRNLSPEEAKILSKLGQWDRESVIAQAMKYNNSTDWNNCGNASYQIAIKNGWYDEAAQHFKPNKKMNGYWTKDRVEKSAIKYKTKKEWLNNDPSAFTTAYRNRWVADVTKHMTGKSYVAANKPRNYWTDDRILANAKKYMTPKEWRLSEGSSYRYAQERGLVEKATAHMKITSKPKGYWTKERVFKDACKFISKKEWRLSNSGGYRKAYREGWLDEALTYLGENKSCE